MPLEKQSTSPFTTPFRQSEELCSDLSTTYDTPADPSGPSPTLPGYPAIHLDSPDLISHLRSELLTPDLNQMSQYLWLAATQHGTHLSSLHQQLVRGRSIVVTENPELHLVWIDNRVFIKPLPPFLLSHAFWKSYLSEEDAISSSSSSPFFSKSEAARSDLLQATLGFMRSYALLIRHESDFRIARESHLLLSSPTISFPRFIAFISSFRHIPDSSVSPRHRFGDLRLSRLNFWAPLRLRRWVFYKVQWQYDTYFSRFYGPLLFVFAILSVCLSAMQVGLAADQSWSAFQEASKWFAVVSLLCICFSGGFLFCLLVIMLGSEALFAPRDRGLACGSERCL